MKTNIHQQATFQYLKQIQKFYKRHGAALSLDAKPYLQLKQVLEKIALLKRHVDSTQDYAEIYKKLHEAAQAVAEYELKNSHRREESTALDGFFIKLFENDNKIDHKIYQSVIKPGAVHTEDALRENLKELTEFDNRHLHLSHPDNSLNAFYTSMLGNHYHPLKKNNVPYLVFQDLTAQTGHKCLRIGAQTQEKDKVNPVFERYLLANARRKSAKKHKVERAYDYVYINLLKTDAEFQDHQKKGLAKTIDNFVRGSEGARAGSLEGLNFVKDLKTAVITLPADGDFFLGDYSMKKGVKGENPAATCLQTLFEQVKDSIQHNRNDFYMTNDVKRRLFGKKFDNGKLEALFREAVSNVMGKSTNVDLRKLNVSPEMRNAILFQFTKFNLTDHILKTLNPKAYNICCKDGIDRGAVHNLWHQMNLRYKLNKPMTKSQFMRYLDAPAVIVKYRPLNHNRNLIWNALRFRMVNDPAFRASHLWAIQWLKENIPHYMPYKDEVLTHLDQIANTRVKVSPTYALKAEDSKIPQNKLPLQPLFCMHRGKEFRKQLPTFWSSADELDTRSVVAAAC